MKRSKFVLILICVAAILGALSLAACATSNYSDNQNIPDINCNEVLFIERNKLTFALDMDIDDADIIERCNCTFIDGDGNEFKVTAQSLESGEVEYEKFDLSTVGSNKQLRIAYSGAVNYIYYDVNSYTANFYLDEHQTEEYKTIKASARLTDTLGLSVWVNLIQCNYSTDEEMRELDPDRAIRFDGWYDSSGNRATGLYTLSPPVAGNERTINFHAHFLTEEEFEDMNISYDASGRRVFSGYSGNDDNVNIPEGVTYIDFAALFKNGSSFKSMNIPSTAKVDAPFLYGLNSEGLQAITVDAGNTIYASYNGALYSKDYSTLYYMPSDCTETKFNSALTEFGSYSCAYWRVTELAIPESVHTLQHYCFAYSAIGNVSGLENVKSIKTGAFFCSEINTVNDGKTAQYLVLDNGKYILSMILDVNITSYKLIDGTVGIAGDAFGRCESLSSIDLGNELKSIGDSAFAGCGALETVTLPASLEKMESNVFYGCSSLKSVIGLPDVTYVDDNGKEYAHTLPSAIFRGCTSLTDVTLPDGITIIGNYAFYNCKALETIDIPDTVTSIGSMGFYGCSKLKSISLPTALRRLGSYAFAASGLVSIDLSVCPDLTALSESCFRSSTLQTITLPDSLEVIPQLCFYSAQQLKSISLGNVKVVADEAFTGCVRLVDIDFGNVEHISYRAFRQCTSLTNVVLPDSVEFVGGQAFISCTALKSITLGSGVKVFGNYTFLTDGKTFDAAELPVYGCRKLETINVSIDNPYFKSIDGVLYGKDICGVEYGDGGVLYCVPCAYANVSFESAPSTRIVAPYALHYQSVMTAARFNEGCESIGKGAFYASSALKEVYLSSTVTHIGAGILLSCTGVTFSIDENNEMYSSDGNLVYKGDALSMYLGLSKDIDIKDGVTTIESAVFMNNTSITEITIPDSVVEIGEKAFSGCSKLVSIHIGSGLRYLDSTAFALLQSLETITVSEDNAYFMADNNILYSKDGKSLILAAAGNGMTELDIRSGVTEICDYAFSYHKTLKSAVIPEGVKTIGNYSFYECRGIEYLLCSQSLETIGAYAFAFDAANAATFDKDTYRFCDTLKFVLFYGKLKSIGDFAFNGQYGIEYTFFKMTMDEFGALESGANSVFFMFGCKDDNGGYYNNYGFGIIRALYSAATPTIDYNGYEWFYFDENGVPRLYKQIPDREPVGE